MATSLLDSARGAVRIPVVDVPAFDVLGSALALYYPLKWVRANNPAVASLLLALPLGAAIHLVFAVHTKFTDSLFTNKANAAIVLVLLVAGIFIAAGLYPLLEQ